MVFYINTLDVEISRSYKNIMNDSLLYCLGTKVQAMLFNKFKHGKVVNLRMIS